MINIGQIFNVLRVFRFGKFDDREKLILSAIRYGYRQNQKLYWELNPKQFNEGQRIRNFFQYKGKVYSKLLKNKSLKKDLENIYSQVSKEDIYNDNIVQTKNLNNFENYKSSFRDYWKKIMTINGNDVDKLGIDEKKLFKVFVEGYVILKYLNNQRQDLSMMSLNNYFMIGSYISFLTLSKRHLDTYKFGGYKDEMKSKMNYFGNSFSLKNFLGGSFYLFGQSLNAYINKIKQLSDNESEKVKEYSMELENELLSMDRPLLFYIDYLWKEKRLYKQIKRVVSLIIGGLLIFSFFWLFYRLITSGTIKFYWKFIKSFISYINKLCIRSL